MKPKTIVTAALLVFLGVSVAYLIGKEIGGRSNETDTGASGSSEGAQGQVGRIDETATGSKVIVYNFHRNVRCANCRKIEALTQDVMVTEFGEAMDEGRLDWHVINFEEPGNTQYAKKFELHVPTVVVVEIRDGQEVRWKDLDQVWPLLEAEDAFRQYVRDEVNAYLKGTG